MFSGNLLTQRASRVTPEGRPYAGAHSQLPSLPNGNATEISSHIARRHGLPRGGRRYPGGCNHSAPDKIVTIGYQKYGNLILLKGRGGLESKLAPLGFKVHWREFQSGPPLLEALNAGAIDFGHAGETPPIFAQAAGVPFVYVAHEPPAPKGEAILVPKNSPINTLADLKGKRIALNKGSNVHFLLVQALEKAGVKYSEIAPIYLTPADARAAFERGAVDASVIWDPFQAAAEAATGARTLTDATGLAPNRQFYLAGQKFADADSAAVDAILAESPTSTDGLTARKGPLRRNSAPASAFRCPFWKSHSSAKRTVCVPSTMPRSPISSASPTHSMRSG